MNTFVLVTIIICATIVVLFVIGCVHDTVCKNIEQMQIEEFKRAFPNFTEKNAGTAANVTDWQTLEFPNSSVTNVETRPRNKYN